MMNEEKLLEIVKREIVSFLIDEYEEEAHLESFDEMYPDLRDVEVAYTDTPDEEHSISYSYDLINLLGIQYVDDTAISTEDFNEYGNREEALKLMIRAIQYCSFSDYVRINEEDLNDVLNMYIDDDGNICEN